jgi:hypothetical protein
MFHIDLHGKKDRPNNSDIDLGVKAIKEYFAEEDQKTLVSPLIKKLTKKMNKVFSSVKLNGFRVVCNPAGELQGRWPDPEEVEGEEKGEQMYTMS